MKHYFLCIVAVLTIVSCSRDDDDVTFDFLVEAQPLGTVSATQLQSLMIDYAELTSFVNTGITVYRVEYNTLCNDDKIKASGIFVIPDNLSEQTPALVFNHGTIANKNEAPSRNSLLSPTIETGIAYLSASIFGCAVLIPDYIGYGASEATVHPYIHAKSLGQSSLDFLRTYIEYAEKTFKMPVSRKVVIAGYSEGGYASVALHKKIQESAADLRIVKTYAGAGPYDIKASFNRVVSTNEDLLPEHLSSYLWVLSTFKSYMNYAKPFHQIYSEEDNAVFQSNSYDFGYLKTYSNVNLNPQNLFRKDFIDGIISGTDTELSALMEQNSLVDFVPSDSLVLFHSEADSWVYSINTTNAYHKMKSRGAPVRIVIVPEASGCNHEAALEIFLQSTFTNMIYTNVFNK
jgi:hypothetical protein